MSVPEAAELRAQFVDEAREYLQILDQGLVRLESAPGEAEVLHELFRAVHSLKGMAGTMGYQPMVELAHAVESVFDRLRSKPSGSPPGPELFDLLFQAADALQAMVEQVDRGGVPRGSDGGGDALVAALVAAASSEAGLEARSPGGGAEAPSAGGGPARPTPPTGRPAARCGS